MRLYSWIKLSEASCSDARVCSTNRHSNGACKTSIDPCGWGGPRGSLLTIMVVVFIFGLACPFVALVVLVDDMGSS